MADYENEVLEALTQRCVKLQEQLDKVRRESEHREKLFTIAVEILVENANGALACWNDGRVNEQVGRRLKSISGELRGYSGSVDWVHDFIKQRKNETEGCLT